MSKEVMQQALDAFEAGTYAAENAAITALREALAAPQPAPVQSALDVTLDGDDAQALYDLLGDDRENLSPVRLLVGDGHSGHGLYVALAEYQDEGAELIASIAPPTPQPAQPAEPLTDQQCRAAFEHWYSSAPTAPEEPERTYELTDESMSELTKECVWLGWQAAHNIKEQS